MAPRSYVVFASKLLRRLCLLPTRLSSEHRFRSNPVDALRLAWALLIQLPVWNSFPNFLSLFRRQRPLLNSFELPTIPPLTTVLPFRYDRFDTLLHRRSLPRLSPGQTCFSRRDRRHATRVRKLLGFSPTGLAKSSSLTLRTGRSPQVALHLSSRKRSYHCWLQGGNVTLTRTSTSLFKRLHRRTSRVCPRHGKSATLTRCQSGTD